MDDTLLERFKNIVAARIGLHIGKEDSEAFHKAGTMLMKSLNIVDPERYLSFLESDTAESKQEWKALIRSITTGESYFFRDKGHFFLLQNTILPELIVKKGPERSLRIWSAGCATGEEPYSVAILLDMLLPDLKGWDISIIGTDINEEALKKAASGIYSEWSFRMVDKAVQSKYFQRHHNEWEIHGNIKKMVKFQYGNLIDAGFFSQNSEIRNMDIILCRNVFIYFGKEAVSSALNSFQKILNDGGYLVTGHSELYGHELSNLHAIMFPEAVIYKKIADYGMRSAESASAEFGMRSAKSSNAKISSTLRTPNTTLRTPDSALQRLRTQRERLKSLLKKGATLRPLIRQKSI